MLNLPQNNLNQSVPSLFQWSRKFNRPLILDGAMGSIVHSKYSSLYQHGLWMNKVLIQDPTFIKNLHLDYIKSGADIITTFTFRTNPYALKLHDQEHHKSEEMVKIAVEACLEAKKQALAENIKPILIAGSNTTMIRCYVGDLTGISDEEIYENHKQHMENLMNSGSDFILNETFGHLREIRIVCEVSQKLGIPFVISLYCEDNLTMRSGEPLQEVVDFVKKFNPLAIGFNCIKYSTMKKIIKEINLRDIVWGCYINCGDENMQETYAAMKGKVGVEVLDFAVSPDDLKKFTEEIILVKNLRPAFVGSCCCSNPDHTKKLAEIYKKD